MGFAGRIIGRDEALAIAGSALSRATAGEGRFVLVSGEAGIGKSAVLGWIAQQAQPECLVLRGICWSDSVVPPYWPWTQVLRAAGLAKDDLGAAARLIDATGSDEPNGAVAATDAQFRLWDAVAQTVVGLAAERPVVVMLDDLHWSDERSLMLLSFVARAVADQRVLLVGAYRDDEASELLRQVAAAAELVPLLGVGRVDSDEMINALPGVTPPPQVREQLWRRSGGNPFFLRELTRLLQAQGGGELPRHLPDSIVETVRRRLARLSTSCVHLLDWAAVAGREVDIALLVEAGGADDEISARDLLAQAGRAGIVTIADPPYFSHDLYRDAILDGMPAAISAAINLAVGRALQAHRQPGRAARIAAHLLRAGPEAQHDAIDHSIQAARDATARLGHEDACSHYLQALSVLEDGDPRTIGVLLELAAADERIGRSDMAMQRYRDVADLSRPAGNTIALAHAALGMQSLGQRSGTENAEVRRMLEEAARRLDATQDPPALQSRVLAALARILRHGPSIHADADATILRTAERAVDLAQTSGDANALAAAKLAAHDALWRPGSAADRLPVVHAMLAAATLGGNTDLVAEAHLLAATALLELGDPGGREELLTFVSLAENLGHARGSWLALTRRATFAQLDGRAEEAARLGEEALVLGRAIGEPDVFGCYCTARWSLVALGIPEPEMNLDAADPVWPLLPLIRAWPFSVRGEHDAAAAALGDFSVLNVELNRDLEQLAVAAVVFAAVGSDDQRRWAFERLEPYAGTHVIVGGCAAYHAAVDHHLGMLARSLGDHAGAELHLGNAVHMHQRLGAAGWARLSAAALADSRNTATTENEFRFSDGGWLLGYAGRQVRLTDAKGLHDLWVILGAQGTDVHVLSLLGTEVAEQVGRTGADPVLDSRAKAEYRQRIDDLDEQIADAEALGRTQQVAELDKERSTLIRELAAAAGLGGRPRRLGDATERARKTVSARVRDALARMDTAHPILAGHLRHAVRMGTNCSYRPHQTTRWRLA